MKFLNALISPVTIFFIIIVIGYFIGKIKIFGISFDLSAILLISVLIGYLMTVFTPELIDSNFENSMSIFSKLGTALFISSIGLTSGASLIKDFKKSNIAFFLIGSLMVCTSFFITNMIECIDTVIEKSTLLGILCGAMTSTPGLSAVCGLPDIIPENAVLGYSCAYIIGVIGIIMFVQLMTRNQKMNDIVRHTDSKPISQTCFGTLIMISVSIISGYIISIIKMPYINSSLGVSGGILCSSILIGAITQKIKPLESDSNLPIYRNFGLVLFFVGSGIPSGIQLYSGFEFKWFLYGVTITILPILFGYICSTLIVKRIAETKLCIIAGGMTSTPAIGVLLKRTYPDLSAYSFAYLGALLTMVIGVMFI